MRPRRGGSGLAPHGAPYSALRFGGRAEAQVLVSEAVLPEPPRRFPLPAVPRPALTVTIAVAFQIALNDPLPAEFTGYARFLVIVHKSSTHFGNVRAWEPKDRLEPAPRRSSSG